MVLANPICVCGCVGVCVWVWVGGWVRGNLRSVWITLNAIPAKKKKDAGCETDKPHQPRNGATLLARSAKLVHHKKKRGNLWGSGGFQVLNLSPGGNR